MSKGTQLIGILTGLARWHRSVARKEKDFTNAEGYFRGCSRGYMDAARLVKKYIHDGLEEDIDLLKDVAANPGGLL